MLRTLFLPVLMALLMVIPARADRAALDVVAPFEIKSADPVLSGDIFQKMDVMETLVEADSSGRLLPGLSDRWSVSQDKLTWRFHIRPDTRFHDGTMLTPAAAANALN